MMGCKLPAGIIWRASAYGLQYTLCASCASMQNDSKMAGEAFCCTLRKGSYVTTKSRAQLEERSEALVFQVAPMMP